MNNTKIPKLRFPGFEGEWEEKKLGEVCTIIMGQSPDSSYYNLDKKGIPLIQGNADVLNRKSIVRNYTSQITKTCEEGDIIMSVRAPVGAISRASQKSCIGRGVCAIKNGTDFIYQYMISIEDKWDRYANGTVFSSINSDTLKSFLICIPKDIQEQEKIAQCLNSIDEQIVLQEELVEGLKEHKKGLMQQLFPQN